MSYNKRIRWKDHVVERPRTYSKTENPDGTETFTAAPGEVLQQGTPQSATNFNAMEDGLQYLSAAFDFMMTTYQAEISRIDTLEAQINAMT